MEMPIRDRFPDGRIPESIFGQGIEQEAHLPFNRPFELTQAKPDEIKKSPDGQQAEKRDVYEPEQLKQYAKRAAEIISEAKEGNFNHYGSRDELKAMFADAANRGKPGVAQLTKAINDELKTRNPALTLEGHYREQTETVDEADYPKNGEAVYKLPKYVKYTYAGADMSLTNKDTKSTRDVLSVRGKELRKEDVLLLDFRSPIFPLENEHRR